MFLSKRYLVALSLTLMLWVPFALDRLYSRKWPFLIVLLLMLISAVGGIIDCGHSKKHILQAGQWLESHVPLNASLYANDYQLMYYSKHFGNDIFKQQFSAQLRQYDYVALRVNKKNVAYHLQAWGKPNQVFSNHHGDQVIIYKMH